MNKDINTTLIIGNGFDLNLGMNTGYKAFYDQLEKINFGKSIPITLC